MSQQIFNQRGFQDGNVKVNLRQAGGRPALLLLQANAATSQSINILPMGLVGQGEE